MSENSKSTEVAAPARTIDTLRNVLFDTIAGLQDKEKPMEIERASAIVNCCDQIVKSAKVEVDFLRAVGGTDTGFMKRAEKLPPGITGTRQHRLGG